MPAPRILPTAAVLLAGALLGACGSGPAVRARSRTVVITVTEFRMSPQEVEAHPGPLVLVMRNRGILAHNVSLRRYAGHRIAGTRTVQPGRSASVRVSVRPGHYRLYSSNQRDELLGLWGTLTVRGR